MTDRDALAALIAEMRSPYAGPGGCSSRSIADAILAAGWRPPECRHEWIETTTFGDRANGLSYFDCALGCGGNLMRPAGVNGGVT